MEEGRPHLGAVEHWETSGNLCTLVTECVDQIWFQTSPGMVFSLVPDNRLPNTDFEYENPLISVVEEHLFNPAK